MSNRRSHRAARAAYDGVTRLLSLAMIGLGVLLVVRGAVIADVLGVGMIAAGAGRLWILARLRRLR
jgi:hypothetical protein